jgi:hypothetical protein
MTPISIAGAGPAGSCAALAALAEGATVRLFEKSSFPRHKVCGEFLSPEVQPELEALKVWKEFQEAEPATIRSVLLHFGRREKSWPLPIHAFGLSRYTLDRLLLDCAVARGAELIHEPFHADGATTILAHGRKATARKGNRLFGFKAHFTGPSNDVVELFFQSRGYAGVSAIESGATNVCGLAPESSLAGHGFEIDRFISQWDALRSRLSPLSRNTEWLITGPLVFTRDFDSSPPENQYPAGDALGFVDPFTGSGILSAMLTGRRAGSAAALRTPSRDYVRQCASLLRFPYLASSLARFAILTGLADDLARWLPGRLLFSLTRPHQALK